MVACSAQKATRSRWKPSPQMSITSSEIFAEKRGDGGLAEHRGREEGLSSIEEEDERLIQLGIHRELRREFTNLSTLSFALGVLGYVGHPFFACVNISLSSIKMCCKYSFDIQYTYPPWRAGDSDMGLVYG